MLIKDLSEAAACISLQVDKDMSINVSRRNVSGHFGEIGLVVHCSIIPLINSKNIKHN